MHGENRLFQSTPDDHDGGRNVNQQGCNRRNHAKHADDKKEKGHSAQTRNDRAGEPQYRTGRSDNHMGVN